MKNFADVHVHFTKLKFDQIEQMLDIIASKGVTDVALQALTFRSIAYNLCGLYWKMNYKKMRLRLFGAIHLTDRYNKVPYEVQAEKLLSLGADGIKFIDMCPDIYKMNKCGINHPKYDKLFELLENRGVPVLIHSADPEEYWIAPKDYSDGTYPSKEQIYQETLARIEKHPNLKVVLAHFFFLSNFPERAAEVLDAHPNVFFDLTPGWEMYVGFSKDIEGWKKFFIKYSDRILFGTDCNATKNFNGEIFDLVYSALTHDHSVFNMPCYGGHEIRGLDLPEEVLEKICYKNYIAFAGEKIAPVDKKGFYECCKIVLNELKENPYDEMYEYGKQFIKMLADDPEQRTAIDFLEKVLEDVK